MQSDKVPQLVDSVIEAYAGMSDPMRPDVLLKDSELVVLAENASAAMKAHAAPLGGPTAAAGGGGGSSGGAPAGSGGLCVCSRPVWYGGFMVLWCVCVHALCVMVVIPCYGVCVILRAATAGTDSAFPDAVGPDGHIDDVTVSKAIALLQSGTGTRCVSTCSMVADFWVFVSQRAA